MTIRISPLAAAIALAFPALPTLSRADDALLLGAPLTAQEQAYNRVQKQVKADLAHARGYKGAGAVVAVLDTGYMGTHIELKTQMLGTLMFDASTGRYVAPTDGNGHGTHVAGIVAGSTGTGPSYGIAPDAKILPIKVFSSSTWLASSSTLASGLKVAAANKSVSVINLSLGGGSALGGSFESALRSAIAADKLVVVAAGNSGGAVPQWPARYAKESWAQGQIIAVGAVDANNVIAGFSNRAGDTANWFLVAPGTSVLSAYNNGGYAYMSGTSMAAPVVSGAAALLEGAWPQLKASQVAAILLQTATDLGAAGVDSIYGHGLLNVDRAMQPVGTLSTPLASASSPTRTKTKAARTTRVSRSRTSMHSSVASWSGLSAAAADGRLRGITVDEFNRDFQTDYGAGVLAPVAEGVSDLLAGAGRALQISEWVMPDGSRFLAVADEQRPTWNLSGEQTKRTLLAGSAVFKLAGGGELAFATGSLAGSYFGLADTDTALANPYLGLAQSAAQMAFGLNRGGLQFKAGVLNGQLNGAMVGQHAPADVAEGGSAGVVELNYAFSPEAMIGVQYADVNEDQRWLGAVADRGMALDGGRTRTLTAHAGYRPNPNLLLAAHYAVGYTADAAGAGLFTNVDGVRSDAFALGLIGRNAFVADDRLAVTVSSPLRITSGSARLMMPVAITEDGDTVFESRQVPLAATGRETKLGLDYAMPLSGGASLSWVAALRHNANHVVGEREAQTGVVYRTAF